ncbi:MAG: hypothetical protein V4696_10620 [Pseudomonadota bacterium]
MQTIKLTKEWTYRTPQVTVEYSAGEHEVTDAIAKAYAAEHGEEADGRSAKAGSPRAAGKAEG